MARRWISALILGAGQASRMGQPKQLLPFRQTTLLGQVLGNVLASQVQETILILGHEARAIFQSLRIRPFEPIRMAGEAGGEGELPDRRFEPIPNASRRVPLPEWAEGKDRLSDGPLKVLINPGYPEGLSSSIRLGVSSLDPRAEAVMVVLGDQPLIDPPTIHSLITAFRESDRGIVAPFHQGKRGHPILLHLKYRQAMLDLRGDVGCREILSACPQDLLTLEVDCPGVIQDIDTPEEYRRCQEGLAKEGMGRV